MNHLCICYLFTKNPTTTNKNAKVFALVHVLLFLFMLFYNNIKDHCVLTFLCSLTTLHCIALNIASLLLVTAVFLVGEVKTVLNICVVLNFSLI